MSQYTEKNRRRKEERQRGPEGRDARRSRQLSDGAFGGETTDSYNRQVVGTSGVERHHPAPEELAEAREDYTEREAI